MTRNQKIIFAVILGLAAFLIFFRLGRQDMLSDDGHYATRALGYFDYMSSAQQTTPVQWFGERPWWSYLSFHDHPPLYFLTQHVFFRLFGDSVTVSRLTSAFAALGAIVVVFFLGRRLEDARTGLLAMGALALNNYFIWQSRIGLLESLFVFWLLLGLLYFLKGLEDNGKFFIWSGLFFGLALLSKYTFFFVAPGLAIYILWQERGLLRSKKFWLGVAVFAAVTSPLVIYNLEMFRARGHFDVQFADLFGQGNEDWPVLGSRVGGFNIDFAEPIGHLGYGMSWPYFILSWVASFVAAFVAWRRRRTVFWLPLLVFIFLLSFLIYVGGANRWMGVTAPFASLILAVTLSHIWRYRFVWIGAGLLALYCLVYIFNTNHAYAAPNNRLWVSTLRKDNLGFNQLDKTLSALLERKRPTSAAAEISREFWLREIKKEVIDFPVIHDQRLEAFPYLIVYDANLSWFPVSWVFDRRRVYNRFFIASSDEFAAILTGGNTRPIFDKYLSNHGVIFIKASSTTLSKPDLEVMETDMILKHYTDLGIEPKILRDALGREAFYIYNDLDDKIKL